MIYSYNKNQGKAISSQIYFWNRTLHVSDSSSVHHQQSSTVHIVICICHTGYADCLLARSRSNYSKNKFEKLVLLVGFIISIYHAARSSECQTQMHSFVTLF